MIIFRQQLKATHGSGPKGTSAAGYEAKWLGKGKWNIIFGRGRRWAELASVAL